ncbi:MAG: DUF6544 family protein [Fibrobacteria bacterium]
MNRPATLHGLYLEEVRAELAKAIAFEPAPMDAAALAALPEPVRRYFSACGFADRPAMRNARFTWDEVKMRRGRGKGWMRIKMDQFNDAAGPARFVYLHALLGGLLPFNGRDKYQDGHGSMIIRALGLIKIADAASAHMDQSGLATFLAEALMLPSAALRPYLRWESIDGLSARAIITDAGLSVRGIFRFNGAGEFTAFDTDDRWQDGHDDAPIPWRIKASGYRDMGGFRLATEYKAVWIEKAGDFEYLRGRLGKVEYNVEEP